jgi:hypothetical protein
MSRRLIAVLVVALGAVFFAPNAAQAAFGIEKWSAITCNANSDTPEVKPQPQPLSPPVTGNPPPTDPNQCNETTPEKWFTQAAGHPNFAYTEFLLNRLTVLGAKDFPDGFVKDIIVDIPEGLSVNPEALPQCPVAKLATNSCPVEALVGVNYFTVALEGPPCATFPPPGECLLGRVAVPVYNLVPSFGVPSMVGFLTTSGVTLIVGSLDPVDQHVTFTISDIHAPPSGPPVVGSRLVFNGRAGNGTYLTMPSN